MTKSENSQFNPLSVALSGSNLIEASAGTGKTYSIAIMMLRLLIEKDIPIEKILMVTFTKAAVAELQERIRMFVRLAAQSANNKAGNDKTINTLVQNTINKRSAEQVQSLLQVAQQNLDQISVMTIHSFCQRVLRENALETGQLFNAEIMSPEHIKQLAREAYNDFWRKKITTKASPELYTLLQNKLTYASTWSIVNNALQGKIPVRYPDIDIDALKKTLATIEPEISKWLSANKTTILGVSRMHAGIKEHLNQDNFGKELLEILYVLEKDNNTSGYFNNGFGDIRPQLADVVKIKIQLEPAYQKKIDILSLACTAFDEVKETLKKRRQENGYITYDEMIAQVHLSIKNPDASKYLISRLRSQYHAVFIDEFQDTDKAQYEIFHTAFANNLPDLPESILFYIGDPKQSIYAFRKADIYTYFKARQAVDHIYMMNVNYRSSPSLLEAMNAFFLPETDFDTFNFENEKQGIDYQQVSSPADTKEKSIKHQDNPFAPMQLIEVANQTDSQNAAIQMVQALLSKDFSLQTDDTSRSFKPDDIGILVRKNAQANAIKEALAKLGIQAVTIGDSTIFDSQEAKDLFYLLQAIHNMQNGSIYRALLTPLAGFNDAQLKQKNRENILEQFRQYQESWRTQGVFYMLRQFIADHDLIASYRNHKTRSNPERSVTNTLHLIDLLHNKEVKSKLEQAELIQWLKKGIDGEMREGDEYVQRLEGDENAVKISTIHKSKGLEYNVVIAPFLDFNSDWLRNEIGYRNPDNGNYYLTTTELASNEELQWHKVQAEQEYRRLLYVTVTRAKYLCILSGTKSKSTLQTFRYALTAQNAPLPNINFLGDLPSPSNTNPTEKQTESATTKYAIASRFHLLETQWRRSSYTGLSPKHTFTRADESAAIKLSDYEQFIFRDLPRGAHTGNLLHSLFEHIAFDDKNSWNEHIEKATKRFGSQAAKTFPQHLHKLIEHVTTAHLDSNSQSQLQQIKKSERMDELEFDFPMKYFNTNAIQALSTENIPLFVRSNEEMEGILNGKIDLFFRHQGKYFLLDWKSNYLGDSTANYGPEQLATAMKENNYHLQYHLYTLASVKFLQLRLQSFDYERDFGGVYYLFLRGMQSGTNHGVFFHKPLLRTIQSLEACLYRSAA